MILIPPAVPALPPPMNISTLVIISVSGGCHPPVVDAVETCRSREHAARQRAQYLPAKAQRPKCLCPVPLKGSKENYAHCQQKQ